MEHLNGDLINKAFERRLRLVANTLLLPYTTLSKVHYKRCWIILSDNLMIC